MCSFYRFSGSNYQVAVVVSSAVVHSSERGAGAAFPVDAEVAGVVELDRLTREEAELVEVVLGQGADLLYKVR